MHDRFTRGFIAGIIAALVPFIIHFIAYFLKLTTLRYADFIGIFVFGHKPVSSGELFFSIIVQTCILGGLGIAFALLIPLFSSKKLCIKRTRVRRFYMVYGLLYYISVSNSPIQDYTIKNSYY